MEEALKKALEGCETDLEGALERFCGDEALYIRCLKAFLDDPTMEDMTSAIAVGAWDDAFTAAHAMKGLAANMGFVPLFHASAAIVVLIRNGRINEVAANCPDLKRCYDDITRVIQYYLIAGGKEE